MNTKLRIEDLNPNQMTDLRPVMPPFDIIYLDEAAWIDEGIFNTIEPIIEGDTAIIGWNSDKVWTNEIPF